MDFLYALYDALVSVNIPSDKARAVVDAMERDMGTTLATKSDLDSRQLLLRHELESFRREMSLEFAASRKDMESGLAALRSDMEHGLAGLRKDMDLMRKSMTIQLGSMYVVGMGLLFAALRLT